MRGVLMLPSLIGVFFLVGWLAYLTFGYVIFRQSGRDPTSLDSVGRMAKGFRWRRKRR
jgi:hypothetical protein